MSNITVTRWWWVRHAPVRDAHLGRLSGQTDVDADIMAAEAAIGILSPKLPCGARWITSNLRRTHQTAEALWHEGAHRMDLQSEPAFAEQAFGNWSNLTWTEIEAMDEHATKAFWDAPATSRPPGNDTENFTDVCARVASRIQSLNRDFAGRDIVCIAHAGPIRAAVALALDLSHERALGLDIKNTSLTRVDYITLEDGENSWRVGGINM